MLLLLNYAVLVVVMPSVSAVVAAAAEFDALLLLR